MYLLYQTPSSEGSRRKQKQRFVPFHINDQGQLNSSIIHQLFWSVQSFRTNLNKIHQKCFADDFSAYICTKII